MSAPPPQRIVLVSADGRARGDHDQYRRYLDSSNLHDFDACPSRDAIRRPALVRP